MEDSERPRVIARADTPHGEIALRRRGEVLELVVAGIFAMDTVDTSTERLLARAALEKHPRPERVLVGGLGLGFTAREVLADPRVSRLDVVELAEPLVGWAAAGLVPELAGLVGERCLLHAADIADVLTGRRPPTGPWDLVLLDVDNGPGFLVHEHNARLYRADLLATARSRLRSGGLLLIWSSHRAPALLAAAREVTGGRADEVLLTVERSDHRLEYALYLLPA